MKKRINKNRTAEPEPGLNRLATNRSPLAISFVWGLAEATFFFFVPDVFLTLFACRSVKGALKGSVAALAGALIGGAIMFAFGACCPETTKAVLDWIPGIGPDLIQSVESQVSANGILALLLGPIGGIPYKIYAVEWGARHGGFLVFLAMSIPARMVRFAATSLAAAAIVRLIAPWTERRSSLETLLLLLFWIGFYGFYFARFGL